MQQILHITPNLPPAICGLGDYAAVVGARIEQLFPAVECRYLAAGYRSGDGTRRLMSPKWFWNEVSQQVESSANFSIVLHYSGYGYNPDGAPAWLAEALANRPTFARNIRLVTFFHELYATGWPWRRAFWQSNRQRNIAVQLAHASDDLLTNRAESAAWLEQLTGRVAGSVAHLPVPSNVGEPDVVPSYFDRPPQAVVFGGAKVKRPFLVGQRAKTTARVCRKLGITKVVEIGSAIAVNHKPFCDAGIDVVQMGHLRKEQVSEQLLQARVGFFDYFPNALTKSGILAALSCHGVGILFHNNLRESFGKLLDLNGDELALKRIATAADPMVAGRLLAKRSTTLRTWYIGHSSRQHALQLHNAIGARIMPSACGCDLERTEKRVVERS